MILNSKTVTEADCSDASGMGGGDEPRNASGNAPYDGGWYGVHIDACLLYAMAYDPECKGLVFSSGKVESYLNTTIFTRDQGGSEYGVDGPYIWVYATLTGDFNNDGSVDVVDLLMLADAWGTMAGDPGYDPECDSNCDGSIDVVDLLNLASNFGKVVPVTLTVNSAGASSVAISSATGQGGTTNYTASLQPYTTVTLTAPASSGGQTFVGWTGDVTSSNRTISFDVNGPMTVTANYADLTLTVNSSGVSSVVITSTTGDGGTTNYTKSLTAVRTVTLTAPATSGGETFIGWTGRAYTSNQTVSFTLDGPATITANYTMTLGVNSSGASSVAITSTTGDGGTTNYTKSLTAARTVTLTAPTSSGGLLFTAWTTGVPGGPSSTTATISFTISTPTTLTANYGTAVPSNNMFANAITISGASGQTAGNNAGATKETGEPNHAGNAGGKSVWWQWTAPAAGQVTISTLGSSFDTLLGIYTGTAVNALTTIASNDDVSISVKQSQVTFTAVSGTTYRIAVDGKNGASGTIILNWKLQ